MIEKNKSDVLVSMLAKVPEAYVGYGDFNALAALENVEKALEAELLPKNKTLKHDGNKK